MKKWNIPFSPPDLGQEEIDEVVDTLKSGWITTGPKTKKLEVELSNYTQTPRTVCLNSATAALELILSHCTSLDLYGFLCGDRTRRSDACLS